LRELNDLTKFEQSLFRMSRPKLAGYVETNGSLPFSEAEKMFMPMFVVIPSQNESFSNFQLLLNLLYRFLIFENRLLKTQQSWLRNLWKLENPGDFGYLDSLPYKLPKFRNSGKIGQNN